MMRSSVRSLVRRPNVVFSLASFSVAVAMGTVLGLSVLALAPAMPSWSRYKLVLVGLTGLAYLGTLLVGNVRRVLLVSLVLAIPLNLGFSPLGDVPYHAGGALAGVVLFLYDFPLIGLLILSFLDTLGRRKPIHFSRIDAATVLLILWTTLSIYNSSQIPLSMFEVLRMVKVYLLSCVIAANVKSKRDTQDVLIALLIGLVLQSLIGVVGYAVGGNPSVLGMPWATLGENRRATGMFDSPNTLGAYVASILCVGLTLWILDGGGRLRLLVRAACVVGFVSLILSFSRGAWISMLAGVAISLFLSWRAGRISAKSIASLVAIGLSALMVGALFGSSIAARLADVNPHMDVIVDRMKLNQVALNMIGGHPLLGVGINTFVEVMRHYDTTGVAYYFPQPVHNVYLLVAAETGVIGLGLFLLVIAIVFHRGLEVVKTHDRFLSACAIATLSALVVLMVNALADWNLRTGPLYAVFWLLIGLVVAVKRMTISIALQEV